MDDAIVFYEKAGFTVHRYMDNYEPGGFAFVDYDEVSVFDLGEATDMDRTTNRAACYLITKEADAWRVRLSKAGLPVTEIADQPWGRREFTLNAASGNNIRIGRNS